MSKDKDINRKLREKKKQRKLFFRSILTAARTTCEPVDNFHFKRVDKFVGCNDALEQFFVPADGEYFRVVHNPPELNDQLIQSEQSFDGLAPSMTEIPNTITQGSDLDDQFEHIADWSLSFNINDKQLAEIYWGGFEKRKTETQKQNYVTRKGDVIALYKFTPKAGLIQQKPDVDGHVVLVEYDDFVLEDYRVKEFGLRPLSDYKNEQE